MKKKLYYSPEMDFLSSLNSYIRVLEKFENEGLDYDERSMIWDEYLKRNSFRFVYNDLKLMFKSNLFLSFVSEYVEELGITKLIDLNTDEFYEVISDYLEFTEDDTSSPSKLYEAYEDFISGFHNQSEEDYIVFNEICFNTSDFKGRLNMVLSRTYDVFSQEIYTDEVKVIIDKELARHQKMLDDDIDEYIKNITILSKEEDGISIKDKKLYINYFANFIYSLSIDKNHMCYGVNIPEEIRAMNEKPDIEGFIKIISDPKRYKLLQLLTEKAYYGAELAKKLDLTTATVSHHIDKIAKLKLLDVSKAEKNRIYFKVNNESLNRYFDVLKSDFLNRGNG